jgi:hypothetical protein
VVAAAVGTLAVGIGIAAGSFLLNTRTDLGGGAAYVPASAPFYFEVRLEPSAEQDAALRELLGRFPEIDGVDLDRPLHDQLVEHLDQMLAAEGVDVSWAADVAPWFDGHVAVAMLDIPMEMTGMLDPMAPPPVPSAVFLLGVTDQDAASAAIERLSAEAGAPEFTETEHAGVTVHVASGSELGAWALTADQLVIGTDQGAVTTAIDSHANGSESLAGKPDMTRLTDALPSDWLAFATYDMTDLMTQAFDGAAATDPEMAQVFEDLLEHQPLRGAMAVSAGGDRFLLDASSDAPTGPFTAENSELGLSGEVPGDVLYYAEATNVGAALAGVIGPIKDAALEMPDGAEQIDMIEAALGADLEEVVSWIDDMAVAAGIDGDTPYAGLVIVPSDMEAGERRLAQLTSFASLGALDPTSGVTVEEEDVSGVTVTTIRWEDPNATPEMMPVEFGGVSLEWATTDDRVLIGVGDIFVRRVLGLAEGDSLATQARFTDAVAGLGGSSNAGVVWLDIAGLSDALVAVMGPMPGADEALGWLEPLDSFVSVTRLEGDVLVQRAALLFD